MRSLTKSALSRRTRSARQPPDETLQERRPLYLIGFGLVGLSILMKLPVLAIAGLLICALGFLPEVWYRWGLRGLSVARGVTQRATFGELMELALTVENRGFLPLPWLQLDDEFTELLPVRGPVVRPSAAPERVVLRHTTALWAYQRVRRKYVAHAVARGSFPLGPVTVRISDPFGILERVERIDRRATVVVHPLVVPIERFGLEARSPFGDYRAPRRLLDDPLRIAGMRDYVPGDEPRRIHWKASARVGTLQSKVYEPSARHTLLVFLDVRTLERGIVGYDPNLVELAFSMAASIASWAIEQRYTLGFYSNGTAVADEDATAAIGELPEHIDRGEPLAPSTRAVASGRVRLPPAPGPRQLLPVLDALARLLPYSRIPMDRVIGEEMHRLPSGATIVYVASRGMLDVPLLRTLHLLKSRGHPVSLLLTEPPRQVELDEECIRLLSGLRHHFAGGHTLWREMLADAVAQTQRPARVTEQEEGGGASTWPPPNERRGLAPPDVAPGSPSESSERRRHALVVE